MSRFISKKIKLNNSGSTLVMTILTIAFISLLASVILAAAVGNVIMKRIDYNSKNAFYTAESVVDEIKVGVGKDSMQVMAGSYEKVLSNLVETHPIYGYDYMMSNDEANDMLKKYFMENMSAKIAGAHVAITDTTQKIEATETMNNPAWVAAKEYLEKYINKIEPNAEGKQTKYAVISSLESVEFIKSYNGIENVIIFNNVVINYKEEKASDTYFSNVTVDINVAYPDMYIDFTASEKLKDFKEFAFVADKNVEITAIDNNITANVNAGIYAGENIVVESGTKTGTLNVGPYIEGVNSVAPNIVARKNLSLIGGASSGDVVGQVAKVNLKTANLWVRNIATEVQPGALNRDLSAGAVLVIDSDCKTFVQDDLNINGKNSVVSIGGEYYGYSYDGVAAGNDHLQSSAIIVNGVGSILNLGGGTNDAGETITLSKLVIGGHSYISYRDALINDYMTGETLSFKADQELYLVPTKYIGINYENPVSNPMPVDVWERLKDAVAAGQATTEDPTDDVTLVNMSGFFAYDADINVSLVNTTSPYETKEIGGMMYVYLNFKDRKSAADYIDKILTGQTTEQKELRAKFNEYAKEILGQDASSGAINIADGVSMYTSGVLLKTSKDASNNISVNLINGGDLSYADLGVNSIDYRNRYTLLTQLLVPLSFTDSVGNRYPVSDIDAALRDLKSGYVLSDPSVLNEDVTATENIVDWELVRKKPYNDQATTKQINGHSYGFALTKVAINGSYTIPDDIFGGVIIANGDVKVNHDFTGLIVASGNIIVEADATVTTNKELVESLITFEYKDTSDQAIGAIPFKNYFDAYKGSGDDSSEDIKIEALEYEDIVSIDNWRKYDDSAE